MIVMTIVKPSESQPRLDPGAPQTFSRPDHRNLVQSKVSSVNEKDSCLLNVHSLLRTKFRTSLSTGCYFGLGTPGAKSGDGWYLWSLFCFL